MSVAPASILKPARYGSCWKGSDYNKTPIQITKSTIARTPKQIKSSALSSANPKNINHHSLKKQSVKVKLLKKVLRLLAPKENTGDTLYETKKKELPLRPFLSLPSVPYLPVHSQSLPPIMEETDDELISLHCTSVYGNTISGHNEAALQRKQPTDSLPKIFKQQRSGRG